MTNTSDGVVINVEGECNGETFIINNGILTYSSSTVIITSTDDHNIEGQSYSLTCAIMGAESLPPSTVEYMYRWNRNGDGSTLSSSLTLNFTPLTRSDDGIYVGDNYWS